MSYLYTVLLNIQSEEKEGFWALLAVCIIGIVYIVSELFAQIILHHNTCKMSFLLVFTSMSCFI